MNEDKGRLLLAESDEEVRRTRLLLSVVSAIAWSVIIIILLSTGLRLLKGMPAEETVFHVLFAFIYLTAGAYMTSRTWNARPLLLYERGIGNYRKGFRLRFKPIEEIGKVEIDVADGHAALEFHAMGRLPPSNIMALEDIGEEDLREVVELFRSNGVKVSLRGKAREWFRESRGIVQPRIDDPDAIARLE